MPVHERDMFRKTPIASRLAVILWLWLWLRCIVRAHVDMLIAMRRYHRQNPQQQRRGGCYQNCAIRHVSR